MPSAEGVEGTTMDGASNLISQCGPLRVHKLIAPTGTELETLARSYQ